VNRWFLHGPTREQCEKKRTVAASGEAFDYSQDSAGKRKDSGCIALRVPDEVPSLCKTHAVVTNGSHYSMNRSIQEGGRKGRQWWPTEEKSAGEQV
jgi:hypothetical protein